MAFLEKFSAAERDLLVSLPYRAGVWISRIDRSGGDDASNTEMRALERIIDMKAASMFESAFVHEVMEELCAHKSDWPEWSASSADVAADCQAAVRLIREKLTPHDVEGYCRNILFIGVEVAKAFREFDLNAPLTARLGAMMNGLMDRLSGLAHGPEHDSGSLLNISYEEDVALSGLSRALGIGGIDYKTNKG
jgi:hypothetical protein